MHVGFETRFSCILRHLFHKANNFLSHQGMVSKIFSSIMAFFMPFPYFVKILASLNEMNICFQFIHSSRKGPGLIISAGAVKTIWYGQDLGTR